MDSEDKIQSDFFKKCWNIIPITRGLLFSVPNGGYRNKAEANKLKSTGVVKGIPDIIFLWKGKMYAIEFKTDKGYVSPDQIKIHELWKINGVDVLIFRDSDKAFDYIKNIVSLNHG